MRYTEFKLTEAPMNPGEYNKAIDTGHTKGVLVGYEFEVCMPEETYKNFEHEGRIITLDMVDQKLKDRDYYYVLRTSLARLSADKFTSLFHLKPGAARPEFAGDSTEEAVNKVVGVRVGEGKALFDQVPEKIRIKAMAEVDQQHRADPMAFLDRLGYILYYNYDGNHRNGGSREIEELGSRMRSLASGSWTEILRKLLPKGTDLVYGREKFSDFFDFDPQQVYDGFNMSQDDAAAESGAATVLKPSLEKTMGAPVTVFTRYHQDTKNMTNWYIEPDGSLHPDNSDDFTAEVVSPPLPAKDAVQALKKFFAMAAQLNLYTNKSTGLHINVSIPKTIDLLKLAVFTGDQHILTKYDRMNNGYADSVTRDIRREFPRRRGIVNVNDIPGKNLFGQQKKDTTINYAELQDIANDISGSHTASISSNGRWISFRHVGGDYLKDYTEIFNVVGRFVRAVIIASDPSLYKNEYIAAVAKLTGAASPKGPGSMSAEIRTKGLPVLEVKMATQDSTFDQAIVSALRWAQLSNTSPIVPPVTVTPELSNEFKARARPGGPYLRWFNQTPDVNFATCLIYPKDIRSIKLFRDIEPSGGIKLVPAGGSYYMFDVVTLPADDIRLRKYLLLLRKQK